MPNYPITATLPRVQYNASSGQTNFAYNWPIFTPNDLKVYRTPNNQPADEETDLLLLNIGYTVSGVGSQSGGAITLTAPATMGDIITIQREISVQRLTNYTNGNAINANDLNADFDRLTMMIQDVNVFIKSLNTRYQVPDVVPEVQTILPQLPQGWFWQGGPNKTVIPVQTLQSPDSSTLRAELAFNGNADGAGANLVGYYDEDTGPMTVRAKLDELSESINTHVLSILTFGASPNGDTDTTTALNAAYAYCAANNVGTILFPRGTYLFSTQPDNTPQLLKLQGEGITLTSIIRSFTPPDTTALFQSIGGWGLQVEGMAIFASSATTSGTGIAVLSDTAIDSQISINNVAVISSGGTWDYAIIIDGDDSAYISYGSIREVTLYGSTTAEILLNNVSEFGIDISAPALGGTGNIIVSGNVTFPSNNLSGNIITASSLSLDFAEFCTFNCSNIDTVTNTVNTNNITIYGNVPTHQSNWIDSQSICNADFKGVMAQTGYQQFPNGLVMQWITVNVTNSPADYSLPIGFNVDNFGVSGYVQHATSGALNTLINNVSSNTLTTVNLQHEGSGTLAFRVMILGQS